ncbi:hypothetical protein KFE25_007012 [Diacronema lutheri]|uniref:Macrocin O-methyltransferase n=1 Tax=Diacronema lutheri TaxID=2081491 RepID=A0A8J6CFF5_DIALT|nr:hypothetical protein KFE25_007012 [Diacronema lutheri]
MTALTLALRGSCRNREAWELPCIPQGDVILYHPNYAVFAKSVINSVRTAQCLAADMHALKAAMPCTRESGLWLEFGVFRGGTIKSLAAFATRLRPSSLPIWGFDSFRGLPEKWRDASGTILKYVQKGSFSLRGAPPFPASEQIAWVIGLFSDTLEPFLRAHASARLALLHIDSDLYSSAMTVFSSLRAHGLLTPGVVIVFDELYNYPQYLEHEMRALWELLGNSTVAHDGRSLAIEMLGVATQAVVTETEAWPQACAVRLVSVDP